MKILTFFPCLFLTLPLHAEEDAMISFDYWGQVVNMLVTLSFIIILIVASVWLLKKLMRSRMKSLNSTTGIKVLERRTLSPKSALYLVDILGKGVVIADSHSGGIQVVTEFPEGVDVEEVLCSLQEQIEPKPFAKTMKKLLAKST